MEVLWLLSLNRLFEDDRMAGEVHVLKSKC